MALETCYLWTNWCLSENDRGKFWTSREFRNTHIEKQRNFLQEWSKGNWKEITRLMILGNIFDKPLAGKRSFGKIKMRCQGSTKSHLSNKCNFTEEQPNCSYFLTDSHAQLLTHVQLFATQDSPSSSFVQGTFQARIQEWVTTAFSTGSSWLTDQTHISALVGGFLTIVPPGKPIWKDANLVSNVILRKNPLLTAVNVTCG